MSKNLGKKFLEFALGSGITMILGLLTTPVITRIISPEQFGKLSMFNTVSNIASVLLILGCDQSFMRFFYEEEPENRRGLLFKVVKVPAFVTIISSVMMLFFSAPLIRFMVGESKLSVTLLFIAQIIFLVVGRFAMLVVRMQQKGKQYSTVQVLGKASYIAVTLLIFIFLGDNYLVLIIATTISNMIMALISILFEREFWFKKTNSYVSNKFTTHELLKYGFPFVFVYIVNWLFQSIDKFTITAFKGYEEVGIYSSANSIISMLNIIQTTFSTFWTPVAYEHYKENPEDTGFFIKVNDIVTFIMILFGIGFITCKGLISLLLGPQYRTASYIMPFLVIMPIMYTISETTVQGIAFVKKTNYYLWIAVISAITNAIGNFILVPSMGAKGAAISTGFSYVIFAVLRTQISKRLYPVKYKAFKAYICMTGLAILALYGSFNNFDLVTVLISAANIIVLCILYKDVIIEGIEYAKKKLDGIKNK